MTTSSTPTAATSTISLQICLEREESTMAEDDRLMNDTTLPKDTQNGLPRKKKESRFGLSDWTRLLSSANDLAQRKGQPIRRIRWDEIRQHNTIHDGWIVLKGKVYNISPYLSYHPGGESIIAKVLGKDVTQLYDKYHRWVNEDGLVGKLLIGYLDTSRTDDEDDDDEDEKPSFLPQQIKDGIAVPAPRKPQTDDV